MDGNTPIIDSWVQPYSGSRSCEHQSVCNNAAMCCIHDYCNGHGVRLQLAEGLDPGNIANMNWHRLVKRQEEHGVPYLYDTVYCCAVCTRSALNTAVVGPDGATEIMMNILTGGEAFVTFRYYGTPHREIFHVIPGSAETIEAWLEYLSALELS